MLLNEWQKFKGWSALQYFIEGNKAYVKELSRLLKISPRTAQIYTHLYEKEGILVRENIGNVSVYQLSDAPLAKELKRTYLLAKISPKVSSFIKRNPDITCLALYGSAASGEYDKSSDVDLLAISGANKINLESVRELEGALGREVSIEIMSVGKWRELGRKRDDFYLSVAKNSIVLYGALP